MNAIENPLTQPVHYLPSHTITVRKTYTVEEWSKAEPLIQQNTIQFAVVDGFAHPVHVRRIDRPQYPTDGQLTVEFVLTVLVECWWSDTLLNDLMGEDNLKTHTMQL